MSVPLRPLAWGPAPGPGRTRPVSVYREAPVPPDLARVAACTWTGEPGWPRPLRVLPDGCADLVWDGAGLRLVTPAAGPVRLALDAPGSPAGIRLRPGVAGHIAGRPVDDLPRIVDLADLWAGVAAGRDALARARARLEAAAGAAGVAGVAGATARRDALVRLVVERLADVGPPDARLPAAVAHLSRPTARPREAAERVGVSPRHLRRLLREQAGLGATDLHRILRFQRFLRAIDAHALGRPPRPAPTPAPALAELAAAGGYADQAHLTRECRRLSGSTPRSLVRGRLATPAPPG